jgi:hypothetical protein
MHEYVVQFLNQALNHVGTWSIDAISEEEAIKIFKDRHQPFCKIISINGRKYEDV